MCSLCVFFGAYEVCGVSCVFSFYFSSFAFSSDWVSFFLREVISGAGAVRGDVVTPLRVHSIRGVATSTVFMQNWSVSKVLAAASWRSNWVFASFSLRDVHMLWKACDSLAPLWLWVQSFLWVFWFVQLVQTFRGNPVFGELSLILRLSFFFFFFFLCFGWWGSGEFSFWGQMRISGILRISILFPRGWWLPGFSNAVWVLVGWQCWLGCFPLPPYLSLVCLSLRLLIAWLVGPMTWLLPLWQWPVFSMVSSW